MKKGIIGLGTLGLFILIFLGIPLFSSNKPWAIALFSLLVFFMAFAFYFELKQKNEKTTIKKRWKEHLLSMLSVASGAILAYSGTRWLNIHPVLSSAGVGLLFHLALRKYETEGYCGSFAGMTNVLLVPGISILLIACFVAFFHFLWKEDMKGGGGKLGTIAFAGSLVGLFVLGESHTIPRPIDPWWILVMTSLFGGILTHLIHVNAGKTVVLSSVLSTFVFAILFSFVFSWNDSTFALFFAASFVGMSGKNRLPNVVWVALASLMLVVVYVLSAPYFNGVGGKLGTMAFVSVLTMGTVQSFVDLIKKRRISFEGTAERRSKI